jgi:undecaprenyl-diphosphatase
MTEYAAAALLGLVQGLTEFLPVSSTGHLIIVSALLRQDSAALGTFEVAIQLGSILAVVILYRRRFLDLFRSGSPRAFSGARGLSLLLLTCLPASICGALLHTLIKNHLFTPASVAVALAAGALFILAVEGGLLRGNSADRPVRSLDEITPKLALGIGCFQCLALWPGFSRSTATIMGGLLLGANRAVAAEYSFLAAAPIMAAATGFSLLSAADVLSAADIPFFGIGLLAAFLSSLAAMKILIRLISHASFRPFAYYRLCLAPLVLWFWL